MNKTHRVDYLKDFYGWANYNAKLLREGRLSEVDIEHIAEEIESMGKHERREMINRLAILIAHLLKWQYQPLRQSRSWQLTIKEQRIQLQHLFQDSPSLKHQVDKTLSEAYEQAIVIAERETAIEAEKFSQCCPFSLDQLLNSNYFPS